MVYDEVCQSKREDYAFVDSIDNVLHTMIAVNTSLALGQLQCSVIFCIVVSRLIEFYSSNWL
jgi:hypothetical protein